MSDKPLAIIQPIEYDTLSKLAKVAAQSGYANKNETQVLFIMLKGIELGISPMQALDGIQVIQNKTTVSPQLMLALINRSGELEDIKIDDPDTIRAKNACSVMMKRKGRSPHTEVFSMEDAKTMGLAGKDNWKKQPAVMLKWRAVAACARIAFPDIIQGVYSPEEMGADVIEDASGELVIEKPDTTTGEIITIPATVQNATSQPSATPPAHAATTAAPLTPESAKAPETRDNGQKHLFVHHTTEFWTEANKLYDAAKYERKHRLNSFQSIVKSEKIDTDTVTVYELLEAVKAHLAAKAEPDMVF
jgi:hypothetical protein